MNIKKVYEDLINEIDNNMFKAMLKAYLCKYEPKNLHFLSACFEGLSYCLKYTEENIKTFDKIKEILFRNEILPLTFMKGQKRIYTNPKYDDIDSEYYGFRNILYSINRFYAKGEKRKPELHTGGNMRPLSISSELIEESNE